MDKLKLDIQRFAPTPPTSGNLIDEDCLYEYHQNIENYYVQKSSVLNMVYPVGSIYMSVNSTSPANLFGGTWQQIQDTFLLSAGSTYTAGNTGGSATHTLTVSEMPSHTHGEKTLSGSFQIRRAGSAGGTDVAASATGIVSYGSKTGTSVTSSINITGSNTHNRDTITVNATHEHDSVGGGDSFSTLPPYLVVYMWKRTA